MTDEHGRIERILENHGVVPCSIPPWMRQSKKFNRKPSTSEDIGKLVTGMRRKYSGRIYDPLEDILSCDSPQQLLRCFDKPRRESLDDSYRVEFPAPVTDVMKVELARIR